MYDKLVQEGCRKRARKLNRIIESHKESRPNIDKVCPELDSRFVNIDIDNKTTFDGWLVLGSLGNKLKIKIPFKRTKHFNKMLRNGKLKSGVRIDNNKAYFNFDIEKPKPRSGDTIGVDIGIRKVFTVSNGQVSENKDGWDLGKIQSKLSRRVKGSKRFGRAQEHRNNYIN